MQVVTVCVIGGGIYINLEVSCACGELLLLIFTPTSSQPLPRDTSYYNNIQSTMKCICTPYTCTCTVYSRITWQWSHT